ncbi:hypothetical protein Dimus_031649 [Dionaea muscipula]
MSQFTLPLLSSTETGKRPTMTTATRTARNCQAAASNGEGGWYVGRQSSRGRFSDRDPVIFNGNRRILGVFDCRSPRGLCGVALVADGAGAQGDSASGVGRELTAGVGTPPWERRRS